MAESCQTLNRESKVQKSLPILRGFSDGGTGATVCFVVQHFRASRFRGFCSFKYAPRVTASESVRRLRALRDQMKA